MSTLTSAQRGKWECVNYLVWAAGEGVRVVLWFLYNSRQIELDSFDLHNTQILSFILHKHTDYDWMTKLKTSFQCDLIQYRSEKSNTDSTQLLLVWFVSTNWDSVHFSPMFFFGLNFFEFFSLAPSAGQVIPLLKGPCVTCSVWGSPALKPPNKET